MQLAQFGALERKDQSWSKCLYTRLPLVKWNWKRRATIEIKLRFSLIQRMYIEKSFAFRFSPLGVLTAHKISPLPKHIHQLAGGCVFHLIVSWQKMRKKAQILHTRCKTALSRSKVILLSSIFQSPKEQKQEVTPAHETNRKRHRAAA